MPETEEMPDFAEPEAVEALECPKCGKTFGNRAGLGSHKVFCKGVAPDDVSSSDGKGTSTTLPKGTPPKAKPSGKRHDTAPILGPLYGALARFVPSPAAQRAIAWQAPGAGRALDQALAGSFVDRLLLQKAASAQDKYTPLMSLVGLPVMLALCEKNPALFPVLHGQMRSAISYSIEAALDAAAEEKKRQDKLREKAEALGMGLTTTDDEGKQIDLIDAALAELLGQPAAQEAQ